MVKLSFNQTHSETVVRAAATILFNTLIIRGAKIRTVSELCEQPRYGLSARSCATPIGPKFARITDLQDGRIDWDTVPYCACEEPTNYVLQDDDILFARTGATTGKTHLVRKPVYAVFASYLIRLRPKAGVCAGYLYGFFQSDNYWRQISVEKEGSAQPNVNGEKLSRLRIPLVETSLQQAIAQFLTAVRKRQDGEAVELPLLPPPINDLRQVVARVEALAHNVQFARSLRETAEAARVALWLSTVESAFNKLDKYTQPLSTILTRVKREVVLKPVTEYLPAGLTNQAKGLIKYPPITTADTKYTSLYSIERDDLVYSKLKVWEGSLALVDESSAGRVLSSEFPTYTVNWSVILREYLDLWLRRPSLWRWLGDQVRGIGGRKIRVDEQTFLRAPLALAPLNAQAELVTRVGKVREWTNEIKRLQSETAAELDALLPAILDRAFKGQL